MNRTLGIVLTILSVLLCGCSGLFLLVFGIITALGIMPYTTNVNNVYTSGYLPSWTGFAMLCVSLFFIAVPVVVGILTLRRKPAAAVQPNMNPGEPLPPAS